MGSAGTPALSGGPQPPAGAAPDELIAERANGVYWLGTVVGLFVLMAVSLYLRTRAINTSYWIDEGLATGIAQYPLHEIPGVLLQDGSPPLYYLILHVWEAIFGIGEVGTRSLSLTFSLLAIPVAWFLARRIAGVQAGWIAALLATGHPFLTYYAQESRMYSLVALEALILSGALVLTFVRRERRWRWVAAVAAAAMLYTHNWGLFAVAGSFVAALGTLLWTAKGERKPVVVDGVIVYGLAGLLYLPWVPSLLQQAKSTGAPWSERPGVQDLISALIVPFGYRFIATILAAVVIVGAIVIARRNRDGDTPIARAAVMLGGIIVFGIGLAWVASEASPAWSARYFAIAVGPALLVAALVLSRVPRVAVAVLCLLALTWAVPLTGRIGAKSNVAQAAALLRQYNYGERLPIVQPPVVDDASTQSRTTPATASTKSSATPATAAAAPTTTPTAPTATTPGTTPSVAPRPLVISPHPEQLPVIAHYLGGTPTYADAMGATNELLLFDWRHALDRLQAARPHAVWATLEPSVEPGQSVVLALPLLRSAGWGAPWTALVKKRAVQWEKMLDADPSLERLGELPRYGDRRLPRGIRFIIYRRTSPAGRSAERRQ